MLAHPSTELVARAPCQLRRAHARSVRAARARLRQQRRLEVDKTRKRDVQTGGAAGALERRPRERRSRWHFLLASAMVHAFLRCTLRHIPFAPLWHFAQSDGSFTFVSKW